MGCRGCLECLLKLLNFMVMLAGLAMVGYGVRLLMEWNGVADGRGGGDGLVRTTGESAELLALGRRPMLIAVSLSESVLDRLPRAWFIYLFIGVGAVLFLISCVGFIGATTKNGCCLYFYSFLLGLLILVELGCAAFIFIDCDWNELILADKTGDFNKIYDFLKENWNVAKWIALGVVVFEALVVLLSFMVRAANKRLADYDSDEEYIAPRYYIRQPLINREGVTATGVPVVGMLDQPRPSRNDPWSKRMREKYGLDTSVFSYNPSEPNRFQQAMKLPAEDRGHCTIL